MLDIEQFRKCKSASNNFPGIEKNGECPEGKVVDVMLSVVEM